MLFPKKGARKLVYIGSSTAVVIAVATVAMFVGKMQAVEWGQIALDCVKWGGATFAAGNAIEHIAGSRK